MKAVDYNYDPKTYDIEDKLAIYPEYYIRDQKVDGNLTLKGSVDYIYAERKEPTNSKLRMGYSLPSHCVFCAIEVKKDESIVQGTGELLGQMKALNKRERYDLKSFIDIVSSNSNVPIVV